MHIPVSAANTREPLHAPSSNLQNCPLGQVEEEVHDSEEVGRRRNLEAADGVIIAISMICMRRKAEAFDTVGEDMV